MSNLSKIGQELFSDENDPTSSAYRRVLVRPRINFWRIAVGTLAPLLVLGLYFFALNELNMINLISVSAGVIALAIYIGLSFKSAVICCVMLYQRFAPERIRKKCRFEPSCSQYMILAVEKYGVCKGIAKGVDRLKRCNLSDGGFDMP